MKVITIDREFGAGGHTVGLEVARRLGIELYDRDIIRKASEASGVESGQLEAEEERLSGGGSFINAIIPVSYDVKDIVFRNESQTIVDFAKAGPCVILGRCGSAVLRDAEIASLNVFLYASPADRLADAREVLGAGEDVDYAEVLRLMKKADKQRRSYFEYYTDRRWGVLGEYDLCLNTGVLGYDYCVQAICDAAKAE